MKFLTIFLGGSILFFSACSLTKFPFFQNCPPVEVAEAYYKSWQGGQPGVRGMQLTLIVKEKTLQLDSIYFRHRWVFAERDAFSPFKWHGYFTEVPKEQTVLPQDASHSNLKTLPAHSFPQLKANEVVISWACGQKKYQTQIQGLQKKEGLRSRRVP
jgi:hypothetical protein